MRILVACEESQEVCKAFRSRGHEAYSCDILPCSGGHPEWHIQGYLEDVLGGKWDMIIAFPPCTYLCSSGLHWNGRIPGRADKTEYALKFVCMILNANAPIVRLENPIGCISTRISLVDGVYQVDGGLAIKPLQIIQPYQYGEDASKATCIFGKGELPLLSPTKMIPPRIVNRKKRWANQTDSGQNKLGPSEERAKQRSKTYPGIAAAMAAQWG